MADELAIDILMAAEITGGPVDFTTVEEFHRFLCTINTSEMWDTDPDFGVYFAADPKEEGGRPAVGIATFKISAEDEQYADQVKPYVALDQVAKLLCHAAQANDITGRAVAISFFCEAWKSSFDTATPHDEALRLMRAKSVERIEQKTVYTVGLSDPKIWYSILTRGEEEWEDIALDKSGEGNVDIAMAQAARAVKAEMPWK